MADGSVQLLYNSGWEGYQLAVERTAPAKADGTRQSITVQITPAGQPSPS